MTKNKGIDGGRHLDSDKGQRTKTGMEGDNLDSDKGQRTKTGMEGDT